MLHSTSLSTEKYGCCFVHPACLSTSKPDERSNNPTSLLIKMYCATSNRMFESILFVIGLYGKMLGTILRPMRNCAPSIVEIVSSKPAIRQEETFPLPNTLTAYSNASIKRARGIRSDFPGQ